MAGISLVAADIVPADLVFSFAFAALADDAETIIEVLADC
jgi:hypothetical protein